MNKYRRYLTPYSLLLEKVQKKELDPEDIDLQALIEDFRQKAQELTSHELFLEAGSFLSAICALLKLKVQKLFGEEPEKKRISLSEVKQVLESTEEELPSPDLDWLWSHRVEVGRPVGSITPIKPQKREKLEIPLYKEFRIEEYQERVKAMDFEEFREFFYSIPDRIERVRFFVAWLSLLSE